MAFNRTPISIVSRKPKLSWESRASSPKPLNRTLDLLGLRKNLVYIFQLDLPTLFNFCRRSICFGKVWKRGSRKTRLFKINLWFIRQFTLIAFNSHFINSFLSCKTVTLSMARGALAAVFSYRKQLGRDYFSKLALWRFVLNFPNHMMITWLWGCEL